MNNELSYVCYEVFPTIDGLTYTWESSDGRIVKVDENGCLYPQRAGEAVVTLTVDDLSVSTQVIVQAPPVYLQSVKLSADTMYLVVKDTAKISIVNTVPEDPDVEWKWTTANSLYATVDEDGCVTTKAVGTTKVILTDTVSGFRSNRESGEGRFDLMLEPVKKDLPGILMEFKARKDISGNVLQALARSGIDQIIENKYAADLFDRDIRRVMLFGIAFSGKQVEIATDMLYSEI